MLHCQQPLTAKSAPHEMVKLVVSNLTHVSLELPGTALCPALLSQRATRSVAFLVLSCVCVCVCVINSHCITSHWFQSRSLRNMTVLTLTKTSLLVAS